MHKPLYNPEKIKSESEIYSVTFASLFQLSFSLRYVKLRILMIYNTQYSNGRDNVDFD